MATLIASKPVGTLNRELEFSFKDFFSNLGASISSGLTGNLPSAGSSAFKAFLTISLKDRKPKELQTENDLGFPLPSFYRETVLNYPFEPGSFAEEFMLPNHAAELIDLNSEELLPSTIGRPIFVGSDGGEDRYFVDTTEEDNGVFFYELETDSHRSLTPTWATYLEKFRATHAQIAADEEAARMRKENKKWWQFWV